MQSLGLVHIEDCPLWRDAVKRALSKRADIGYIAGTETAAEGMRICRSVLPAIVILDLYLPDVDGLLFLRDLFTLPHPPKVLLLSCRSDEWTLHQAWTTQVAGLVWKNSECAEHLKTAFATLIAGRRYFPDKVLAAIAAFRSRPDAFYKILSPREIELVALFAEGLPDAVIAAQDGCSPSNIHSHKQRIMGKLNLHRTIDLATWAREKGITAGKPGAGGMSGWSKQILATN